MTTMNISLPDSLKVFIDRRLAEEGFNTISDYFQELVRQDQARKEQKQLEAVLLERQQGDDWEELTPTDWNLLRQELQDRLAAERKS